MRAALWGVSGLPVTQGVREGLLEPLPGAFRGLSSSQGQKPALGDSCAPSISESFRPPGFCSVLSVVGDAHRGFLLESVLGLTEERVS